MVSKKRKTASDVEATTAVASTSAAAASEEVNFPRGGASTLTPVEYREISNKVASDLFTNTPSKTTEEPVQKKRKAEKKKKVPAATQPKSEKKRVVINELSFKKLTVGTLLLGCISHINDLELIVALPHQLVGVIPITEISTPLTSIVEKVAAQGDDEEEDENITLPNLHTLFHVGQWVRCRLTLLQDRTNKVVKKRIELSMKPEVVNSDLAKADVVPGMVLGACVESVEDHGYIMSLGVKDLTAFCKTKDAAEYIESNEGKPLVPGQIVDCVISSKAGSKRSVDVVLSHNKISHSVITEPFSRITSVTPGQLVNGMIEDVASTGLVVKFMGLYEATIDASHLPLTANLEEAYRIGTKINFRIMYCILNTEQKTIGGSLLPHVLELKTPELTVEDKTKYVGDVFPIGSFLDDVEVVRITHSGLNVSIPSLEGVTGFVHISRLADEHIKSVSASSGKFKIGTTHRARVLGYNPTDSVLQLTLQPSVLAEKYLSISDVKVGSMVTGIILKLMPSGLLVKLSKNIFGLVPTQHLADVQLTHPELKFKTGAKVKGRVLLAEDGDRRRIILTLKNSLIKSDLPIITSKDDIKVGTTTHGVIVSVKRAGCIIGFYNNITAFAPASEMTEASIKDITEAFRVGQTLKVTFISVDEEKKNLVVSCINSENKFSNKKASKTVPGTEDEMLGTHVVAKVKEAKRLQINVTLPNGMEGRVHLTEMFKSIDEIKNRKHPLRHFRTNKELEVKVLGVRDVKLHTFLPISNTSRTKQTVECSLLEEPVAPRAISDVKVGQKYLGFVTEIARNQLRVSIGSHVSGIVRKQHTSSDLEIANNFNKNFAIGEAIEVAVLTSDPSKNTLDLINVDKPNTPTSITYESVTIGQILQGVVRKVDPVHGLLVQLTGQMAGKVILTDISDKYVENPTESIKEDTIIRCAVVAIDASKKRVDLSLRESRVSPDTAGLAENREIESVDDVSQGDVLYGYVENISDSGVFIQYGRHVNARVKIANLSDSFVKEWKTIFHTGQLVKSKIVNVEKNMKRIEATLKESDVNGTSPVKKAKKVKVVKEDVDMEEADDDTKMEDASDADSDEDEEEDEEEEDEEEESEEEIEDEDEEMEEDSEDDETPALAVGGFDWTGQAAAKVEEESDSEDEEEEEKTKKKSKKQISEDKTAELSTLAPQVSADYERILIGSPNSSYLWINYMAYQLQLSEVAKAREIGERALKTISFREEQEKLNVWVAMLNLENNFGTDESLNEVFKRAIVFCEPKKIYLQLAKIYERSEKFDKAEALWTEATKKFSQSSKVWTLFGLYCLQNKNFEKARELLQKSLKSLPKHKHIKTITKFAQMEFKHGEPERGRTIFEGVLGNYPKRVDLWNIYLDMEIKEGDKELIRRLFERVTSLKFSSKKMKSLFKKWLQYESANGSEADIEHVKEKALAYVENKSAPAL
ncbi:hypothetical protein J3Q64DRAFT_1844994 [Phycomyces blakesleeanus]|uniref:S1 motif domain-containing protein n=1 Tax=Phycomyces blakesleeanus TaxID=4837 RepID=A0ABR3BFU9_PHYBL